MAHGDGIDWVESAEGKWLGYIRGLGKMLPHIFIIKEPWEPEAERGGWIVFLGEHFLDRKYATIMAAQGAAVKLAIDVFTEALLNLAKETK